MITLNEYILDLLELVRKGYGDKNVTYWKFNKNTGTCTLSDVDQGEAVYSKNDDLIILND